MLFKAISASVYGIDAYLVQVEVDVGTGRMEDFNVVGLPDNAVKESRIQTIAVPETNAKEAAVVDGIKVFALKSLPQAVDLINSPESFTSVTVDAEHMRAMVTLPFSSG
jgi:predicted ATPase with chaperone activity